MARPNIEGAVVLRSSNVEVIVIPHEGGRIASLRSVQSGLEFLTQARVDRIPVEPSLKNAFQIGPCAGAEECLPTVGPCEDRSGGSAPDHGDFWQLPWHVDSNDGRQLQMHAVGFSRPFHFERSLRAEGASLYLDYRVTNVGLQPLSFLYAWHPLFVVEKGDRIVLPSEVGRVNLYYSRHEKVDPHGRPLTWPILDRREELRDLSVALAPYNGAAEMIYTERLHMGRCGLFRSAQQQGVIVSFDPAQLPYLGVWFCFGGWPLTGPEPKQVAVALEPTTAPCNTLATAEAARLAIVLEPGDSFSWNLHIELTRPGASYDDFCAFVQQRVDGGYSSPRTS